ncbi:BBE domain-containing protein [Kitasatospora aureofaciens]|nr:BBE domain-containing protein [Kitasatospora aureofaciens]
MPNSCVCSSIRRAAGIAHRRLSELEAKCDPANVFRVNQNTEPAELARS